MQATVHPVDPVRLDAFLGHAVQDMGAAMTAPLVVLGDRLGLFRALADSGPATAEELAAATKTAPRLVREWLNAQAAAGNVDYDAAKGRYALNAEQAFCFADESSPAFLPGFYQVCLAAGRSLDRIEAAMRGDGAVPWSAHDAELFIGTERFFRPSYATYLTSAWIPALEGVTAKLQAGARVADVGCGHGASTLLLANAYPRSHFDGFDAHGPSIDTARQRARAAGVEDRARFAIAMAQDFPGVGYDLVAFFDCFHDMGDPLGAARQVRKALAPDGTWLMVEPMAGESVSANLNPVGRVFYGASTLICTPNGLSQAPGRALGAQASDAEIRAIVVAAGFKRFRRAAETSFNRIFEIRP